MSDATIADRAVQGSGHRAKKTRAFNRVRPQIAEGLGRGASVASIYREVTADGHDVGTLVWFRVLVGRMQPSEKAPASRDEQSPPTAAAAPPSAERPTSFGDQRFTADYE